MSAISRANAVRSVSQGMPPRTPETSTPNVKGAVKKTKIGIVKNAVRNQIPPYSQSEEPIN